MDICKEKREKRLRRHRRVRGSIHGSTERPRLCVFRSNRNIFCQVVDDERGLTLASASSLEKPVRQEIGRLGNAKQAAAVGQQIAQKCQELGVTKVCFDRGGYRFHGRVKALADAARKGGLTF